MLFHLTEACMTIVDGELIVLGVYPGDVDSTEEDIWEIDECGEWVLDKKNIIGDVVNLYAGRNYSLIQTGSCVAICEKLTIDVCRLWIAV
jgi:hypothetical protein